MKRLALTTNQRSQIGYISFAAFSYIPLLLVSGTFLVDLLQICGFTDGSIGVIASLGTFLAVANLFVFFIGNKIRSPKRMSIFCYGTALFVYVIAYILALLPMDLLWKQILIISCVVLGLLLRIAVNPFLSRWVYTFVSMQERGKFTATNSLVSLVFAVVLAPLLGSMRDYFFSIDKMEVNFAIIAAIIFVMDIISIICMLMIKDAPNIASAHTRVDLKDIFRHTFQHKSFYALLLFYTLWNITTSISNAFWDVYKMGDLNFSVATVQIIGVVSNVLLILSLRPMGRLADRFSFLWCMRIGLIVAAGVYALGIFTTPATSWMAIVYTIIFCFPSFAVGSNFDNLLLDYTDANYYTYAIALRNTVAGMISFGASVLSSSLLNHIQGNGNTLFGISVYAQQVQAALSLGCIIILYLLATFVLTKLPKAQHEK